MGFLEEVSEIMENAGEDRRTLLFSATMPREVMNIAKKFMGDYDVVTVKREKDEAQLTELIFHEVNERDRFEALCRVVDAQPEFYGLVFCRTRADADRVAGTLAERGYPAEPIHGDLSQARREDILIVSVNAAVKSSWLPMLPPVVSTFPIFPMLLTLPCRRTRRALYTAWAVPVVLVKKVLL